MEACSGAHHWARLFTALGHAVRRIAPKFVTPYRMSGARGKNDAADAAAICEALQRPAMRFVPPKSEAQQGQLCVHRARQGYVEQRTATLNRIRGLLSEFGIVLPLKAATVRRQAAAALEDLPGWANTVIGDLLSEVRHLDERIAEYDRHIGLMARQDTRAQRLMRLAGVGETTATALLASIGNGREFKGGRQLAAWLGLVPGQYSSGGKARLGRITKASSPAGYGRRSRLLNVGCNEGLGGAGCWRRALRACRPVAWLAILMSDCVDLRAGLRGLIDDGVGKAIEVVHTQPVLTVWTA